MGDERCDVALAGLWWGGVGGDERGEWGCFVFVGICCAGANVLIRVLWRCVSAFSVLFCVFFYRFSVC